MIINHQMDTSQHYIDINALVKLLFRLRKEEILQATLLGIGPISETIVYSAVELAAEDDFPLIFIASRNQVDADELGGGYVMNWNQKTFCDTIDVICRKLNFNGLVYKCRDHGGPWQRNNEWEKKLSTEEAMILAKKSYLQDIISGFNVVHIDPTKDPHKGYVPLNEVIDKTVELITYIENERKGHQIQVLDYEIGTEETKGSLIDGKDFEQFIIKLTKKLESMKLPQPSFIVGQTGTLVKMNRNVGQFNEKTASKLSSIAMKYKIGFKEHNADYLSEEILKMHPKIGITAANVAPEFGVVETETYLKLAQQEQNALMQREDVKPSNFVNVLTEAVIKSNRWEKWLYREDSNLTEKEIRNYPEKMSDIVRVCGHYVFNQEEVKLSIQKLFENLKMSKIVKNPERVVIDAIKKAIKKYIIAFNLKGLTSKIRYSI